eukprot:4920773-Pyramimonas_sp.AAC.1
MGIVCGLNSPGLKSRTDFDSLIAMAPHRSLDPPTPCVSSGSKRRRATSDDRGSQGSFAPDSSGSD